jgi:hypothetical protein
MKRFSGLLSDTWWFWLVFAGVAAILVWRVSFVFLSSIPIGLFAFLYFGLIRYDEQGNRREGF